MKYLIPILLLGCQTTSESGVGQIFSTKSQEVESHLATSLAPLQFSGTILILTGAALLFVSRGVRGWIPVALGVALTITMAVLTRLLESEAVIYLLISTLLLAVIIAANNYTEIRKWIRSHHSSQSRQDI